MINELKSIIDPSEHILFEGKPDGKCYILKGIFNANLPIFLFLGTFFILLAFVFTKEIPFAFWLVILFLSLKMRPVWIYLAGVVSTIKKYKNSAYIITNKAIYLSTGEGNSPCKSKTFQECAFVEMNRSRLDCFCNTGDVVIMIECESDTVAGDVMKLESIKDFHMVYRTVKDLIEKARL